ncbi:MAG: protease complex subunit PrcB family protein [Cyclonatronaceae bacterium]
MILSEYPFCGFSLVLASLLMMMACAGNDQTGGENGDTPPDTAPELQTLSKGSMSDLNREGGEVVIRSEAEFEEFWNRLSGELVGSDGTVPDVDFDTFIVVGVFMGEQPSSGYDISIERVEQPGEGEPLQLEVRETEPGPECMNMTVITHPYHIIKLNKTDAELQFNYETEVNECS